MPVIYDIGVHLADVERAGLTERTSLVSWRPNPDRALNEAQAGERLAEIKAHQAFTVGLLDSETSTHDIHWLLELAASKLELLVSITLLRQVNAKNGGSPQSEVMLERLEFVKTRITTYRFSDDGFLFDFKGVYHFGMTYPND